MEYHTPVSKLFHWEKTTPDLVYLKQPINGAWQTWTWKQTAQEVRQLAGALLSLGLPKGSHIALLSKNCAHWMICDLAIMMVGHVSVPLYPNLQQQNVHQILTDSESVVLFAGKLDAWDDIKNGVPDSIKCISLPFCDNDRCEDFSSFIKSHPPLQQAVQVENSDLCSIIYTSGTSGAPKGAMFSFEAFAFVPQHAIEHLGFASTDRFFSYLPLSHIAERMLVEMVSLYVGGQVSFAESLQTFAKNVAESRPTIFLGVHRIWSRFQQGILTKIPQKKLNVLLNIPIFNHFIKRKIRKGLGLNEASMVLTGASPTPPDLIKWFERLGIKIQEAYAMTENCCYSHVTQRKQIKIGFVGQPLPLCEVRLGDENEIQIKHKAMMTGYFKDPERTAEAFTNDGFLKTGDEGYIDNEQFLKITGRIKDLFKTAKGKYVAPSPIEMKFSTNSAVEQVCVVGTALPQPIALLTLSALGKKMNHDILKAGLKDTLQHINDSLDHHEKLSKIIVLNEEWQVENNLLTPSLKIRRNEIEKRYAAFYSKWSDENGLVTFVENPQSSLRKK